MKFILASNSPRRRQLLSGLDIPFEVRLIDGIDESYPSVLPVEQVPVFISRRKAEAYTLSAEELLITADTIVALDGEVIGKPVDLDDARRMLRRLSGRTHHVITGVTLRGEHVRSHSSDASDMYSFGAVTKVTFDSLSDSQIDYYVDTYRPLDKAGGYGVQEWIGYVGVSGIEGSYYNVMGLPVQRLAQALHQILGDLYPQP